MVLMNQLFPYIFINSMVLSDNNVFINCRSSNVTSTTLHSSSVRDLQKILDLKLVEGEATEPTKTQGTTPLAQPGTSSTEPAEKGVIIAQPRKRGRPRKDANKRFKKSDKLPTTPPSSKPQRVKLTPEVLSGRPKRNIRRPGRFVDAVDSPPTEASDDINTQYIELFITNKDKTDPNDSSATVALQDEAKEIVLNVSMADTNSDTENVNRDSMIEISVEKSTVVDSDTPGSTIHRDTTTQSVSSDPPGTKIPRLPGAQLDEDTPSEGDEDSDTNQAEEGEVGYKLTPFSELKKSPDPKTLYCYICIPPYAEFKAESPAHLAGHTRSHHLISKAGQHFLSCPQCKQLFKLSNGFRPDYANKFTRLSARRVMHHMIREHRMSYPKFAKIIKCADCDFYGIDQKDLIIHQENKHRMKCKLCNKVVRKNYIERHIIIRHSDQVKVMTPIEQLKTKDTTHKASSIDLLSTKATTHEDTQVVVLGDDCNSDAQEADHEITDVNTTLSSTLEEGEIRLEPGSDLDKGHKEPSSDLTAPSSDTTPSNVIVVKPPVSEGRKRKASRLFANPEWDAYFQTDSWTEWEKVREEETTAQVAWIEYLH